MALERSYFNKWLTFFSTFSLHHVIAVTCCLCKVLPRPSKRCPAPNVRSEFRTIAAKVDGTQASADTDRSCGPEPEPWSAERWALSALMFVNGAGNTRKVFLRFVTSYVSGSLTSRLPTTARHDGDVRHVSVIRTHRVLLPRKEQKVWIPFPREVYFHRISKALVTCERSVAILQRQPQS